MSMNGMHASDTSAGPDVQSLEMGSSVEPVYTNFCVVNDSPILAVI